MKEVIKIAATWLALIFTALTLLPPLGHYYQKWYRYWDIRYEHR